MSAAWITVRIGFTNAEDAAITTLDMFTEFRSWLFERSGETPIETEDGTYWGAHMVQLVQE